MRQDYIVTVPKTVNWDEYLKELHSSFVARQSIFFRIPHKVDVVYQETKCFVVYDGAVRGFMFALTCDKNPVGFTCFYTGKKWPPGIYIERIPQMAFLRKPIPMRGFRGIRKFSFPEGYLASLEIHSA